MSDVDLLQNLTDGNRDRVALPRIEWVPGPRPQVLFSIDVLVET